MQYFRKQTEPLLSRHDALPWCQWKRQPPRWRWGGGGVAANMNEESHTADGRYSFLLDSVRKYNTPSL
jgi:hypothetical protein